MSKEIFKETKRLPSITLFWGGDKDKQCIQLTKLEKDGLYETHQFITLRVADIKNLIKRLEKVK